jgi:hypothetical protein
MTEWLMRVMVMNIMANLKKSEDIINLLKLYSLLENKYYQC